MHTLVVRSLYGLSQLFCYGTLLVIYLRAKVRTWRKEGGRDNTGADGGVISLYVCARKTWSPVW